MLFVHTDFPGKNTKVIYTTCDFLQKLAITQKFKMADLDFLQSLK